MPNTLSKRDKISVQNTTGDIILPASTTAKIPAHTKFEKSAKILRFNDETGAFWGPYCPYHREIARIPTKFNEEV